MKAVIFDMDGLMFDTERLITQAWDYAGQKMGIGKAGHMVLKTLGMNAEMTREIWKSNYKDKYNEAELYKYTIEFMTGYYQENKVPVKKGLYELLEYLKQNGFKMAVASSSVKTVVERNVRSAEVFDYFSVIVCGDMVQKSKPEPDIYLKACELLGENPEDCYALEDSRSGLLSAYRAGCKTIMVPDLWHPDEETEKILTGKFQDLSAVKAYFARVGY